ncbi:hypothetical protein F5Y14DRAFT_429275 [Nemania sp. NC0429]|nr:hypothetical protein F5Y14DRAFT_429275 [Nemania sp. NC0429]
MSFSSSRTGDSQSPDDAFNDNFDSAQDTFNNTAKSISTAWIVGIVVIALAVIVSAVLAIWLLRRRQRRRRARHEEEGKDLNDTAAHETPSENQNPSSSAPQSSPQMAEHRQSPYPEAPAINPATLFEAQDTHVAHRNTPTVTAAGPYTNNKPGHELSGIDSGRQELPVNE